MTAINLNASRCDSSDGPKVSVLMPVFNAVPYLQAAIQSVQHQSFQDWELILIDDGSTDGSRAACEHFVAEDPRVRLISRTHRGLKHTRNEALFAAQGQYVALLDSDDVAMPKRLEQQVEYLDSHPETVVVGGQAFQIDHENRPLGRIRLEADHASIESELLMGRGSALVNSCATFRRDAALTVGGYRHDVGEDLDFFLRLAELGRLENMPNQLIQVRRHLDSSTALCDQKRIHQLKLQILEEAYQARGLTFDPARIPMMNHASSEAEATAVWLVLACRSGEWRTAIHYALRTLNVTLRSPAMIGPVIKRLLYTASPAVLRRFVTRLRTRSSPVKQVGAQ
ncbi:MAG: glycosyltransferase family 2 protein [Planctomycetota bacterium]